MGSVCVRKGVPAAVGCVGRKAELRESWFWWKRRDAIKPLLTSYCGDNQSIRVLDFCARCGSLYRSADIFVFPTLEEGGPQVTYEAAGCGLPVVTTPMGAARLVKDGLNGLIVNAIDVDGLAGAIAHLAASPELRDSFGQQARMMQEQHTYEKVGLDRAMKLNSLRRASHRIVVEIHPISRVNRRPGIATAHLAQALGHLIRRPHSQSRRNWAFKSAVEKIKLAGSIVDSSSCKKNLIFAVYNVCCDIARVDNELSSTD